MWLFFQNPFEQARRVGPDGARPVHHPQWRPLEVGLMALGAMFGIRDGPTAAVRTKMRSHAHALVEDRHRFSERAHLHQREHATTGSYRTAQSVAAGVPGG